MLAAGLMVECTQKGIKWMHLVRCALWPKWLNLEFCLALLSSFGGRSIQSVYFDLKHAHFFVWFVWSAAFQIKFQINWKARRKFLQLVNHFVVHELSRHHYFLFLFICPRCLLANLPACPPNSPIHFVLPLPVTTKSHFSIDNYLMTENSFGLISFSIGFLFSCRFSVSVSISVFGLFWYIYSAK